MRRVPNGRGQFSACQWDAFQLDASQWDASQIDAYIISADLFTRMNCFLLWWRWMPNQNKHEHWLICLYIVSHLWRSASRPRCLESRRWLAVTNNPVSALTLLHLIRLDPDRGGVTFNPAWSGSELSRSIRRNPALPTLCCVIGESPLFPRRTS